MHAVEVSHLTKEYRLGAMQSLRQIATSLGGRLTGRKVAQAPLFKALDDVSFTVEPGEVVGIIGHNGAGKSTLLKMLSRISTPTSGHVKVNGRVAPLIEVGAGFDGEAHVVLCLEQRGPVCLAAGQTGAEVGGGLRQALHGAKAVFLGQVADFNGVHA